MFFATDWNSTYQHFVVLADAITFARHLGATAVVYGLAGQILWIPLHDY